MSDTRHAESRGLLRAVGGSAGARMLVLPFSAVLGIFVTRLIIDNYGEASYAQYMLLVGIATLIPFADLGISASIMNAVGASDDPAHDRHVRGTLITCMRILAGSATTLSLVALFLTLSGSWDALLGKGLLDDSGNLAAGLCLAMLALAMFVGFGQRILIGLGLTFVTILVGGLTTPIVLLVLWVAVRLDLDFGPYVAVVSYAAIGLTGAVCLGLANRRVKPVIGQAFRAAFRLRTERGDSVFATAWPMLIQMVALPLAMQSDRLVLSHASSVRELSTFSLASQMYSPIFSVSVAASMSLWPIFARQRAKGGSEVSAHRLSLLFGALALAGVVVMSLASGFLAQVASGGAIRLSFSLLLAFSLLMVLQAAKSPLGMAMTDAKGLRFQAYMVLLMLPVNVGISVVLAVHLGAVGPVIGSIVGVAVFQLGANWWYVARTEASLRPAS